jgi:beta-glucosidase
MLTKRWLISCCLLLSGVSASGPRPAAAQSTVVAGEAVGPTRAERLLPQLQLSEKIALLSGGSNFSTTAVPRLNIPSFRMSDGPLGAHSPGPSTAFAAGIGLAASWDPQLAFLVGAQMGRDARARGAHFLLAPGVNIYRAAVNGRNFEYYGEDPFLGAQMAVGFINGVQTQGVSATVKHFAGNNSEFARFTADAVIDERTLREIYLPIFEAAVKQAHVGAVMAAYNKVNGSYMSANAFLDRQVLKQQWGFDGVLMSDWGATHDGIASANAGLDLEMPVGAHLNEATLGPALGDGRVTMAIVDDKIRRLLALVDRFGWLERAQRDPLISLYNRAGSSMALRNATEAVVLLKNADGLLPLDKNKIRTLAVIGPNATPARLTGGGSGSVPAFASISLLQGLSDKLAGSGNVTYARGLISLKSMAQRTPFTLDAAGSSSGVIAEVFAEASFAGPPLATRIEQQMIRGSWSDSDDPEEDMTFDLLPPAALVKFFDTTPTHHDPVERWTGWFTAAMAGNYTVFVEDNAGYRLKVDDRLVIDSASIPRAELQQAGLSWSAGPHKVVIEQTGVTPFSDAAWRIGIVRDGTLVDPYAKQLATAADVVILAVGFDGKTETEGADREFALPPGQLELIREIAALNARTIVLLNSGGAVETVSWLNQVPALLAAWYPGQQGGAALADLIMGDANPCGRLPISWERDLQAGPSFANYYYNQTVPDAIAYREGVFVGYRGYQHDGRSPLFPFGFGLSYTSFRYEHLRVDRTPPADSKKPVSAAPLYQVSFDVTNTGSRAGADVAQVYVGERRPTVPRPPRELRGFSRVELAPGETKQVSVPLTARSFSYFDVGKGDWHANAGRYAVELAESSADVRASVEVTLPHALDVSVSE